MVRDVLVASMNKGQFPFAMLTVIVLAMIVKMPPADVSRLAFRLFDAIERHELLGYIFSIVSLTGWFFHAKYQRRIITDEMTRLSGERNSLQSKALGKGVKSSEARQ